MQIYGPFRVSTQSDVAGPRSVPSQPASDPAGQTKSAGPIDQLDLSPGASAADRLGAASPIAANGEIRIDRVAEIRRQIAAGSYETPDKLDAAIDRLLDSFA